jgi:branched-chain amino acid transport system ATP-binding protein
MLDYFPKLRQRMRQQAGTLSGGEQQMLAIARALMGRPRLLLLDEPSVGLAPIIVQEIFEIMRGINLAQGTAMLLVEQNAARALKLAHHAFVLETGRVVAQGNAADIARDPQVRKAYLG